MDKLSPRTKMILLIAGGVALIGLLVLQGSRQGGSQDAPDAAVDLGDSGDSGGLDIQPISINIDIPDFKMPAIPCGCGEQLDGLYHGISDFGGRIRGA